VTNDKNIRGSTGPRVVLLDSEEQKYLWIEKNVWGGIERLKKLDKKNKSPSIRFLFDRRLRVGGVSGPGTLCRDSEVGQ
jgi:hypothetical protein